MLAAVLLILVPAVSALCPVVNHTICNEDNVLFACVCQVAQVDESPVPEVSCNHVVKNDEETGNFPVISVQFSLDKTTQKLDSWPEAEFKSAISSSLRVNQDDVIVLRASCQGSEDELTVQFVIVKKEVNVTAVPITDDQIVDGESVAKKMKAMGHLSKIANLDVDNIEFTEELVAVEFEPSNAKLILQAIVFTLVFGAFFVIGLIKVCKKNEDEEYSDDLQKP